MAVNTIKIFKVVLVTTLVYLLTAHFHLSAHANIQPSENLDKQAIKKQVSSLESHRKIVTLRRPSNSKLAQYISTLLIGTYEKIGYNVRFVDVAGVSELPMADKDRLSGALARFDYIEKQYPNLIRVPVPVLEFNLIEVKKKQACASCEQRKLHTVSYIESVEIAKRYVEKLPEKIKRFPVETPVQLSQLLAKGRLDAIYLIDSEIAPQMLSDNQYQFRAVDSAVDYHYLARHQAHLLPLLTNALQEMAANGEMAALKKKYGLKGF